uniref:BET bromodomain protein n=1 Tax=Pithovirus LCPAC104 TaxID=2506589 RepID=A0A481Z437_9VIRU|nr:MAG: BET bromodomain protein [Pithovirus LCPAC104]
MFPLYDELLKYKGKILDKHIICLNINNLPSNNIILQNIFILIMEHQLRNNKEDSIINISNSKNKKLFFGGEKISNTGKGALFLWNDIPNELQYIISIYISKISS